MTKSIPFVMPVLAEYMGLWRDCKGRVLKSYSAPKLRLELAVVGLWDSDRLGVVRLAMLVVLRWAKRGRWAIFSSGTSMPTADVELWN